MRVHIVSPGRIKSLASLTIAQLDTDFFESLSIEMLAHLASAEEIQPIPQDFFAESGLVGIVFPDNHSYLTKELNLLAHNMIDLNINSAVRASGLDLILPSIPGMEDYMPLIPVIAEADAKINDVMNLISNKIIFEKKFKSGRKIIDFSTLRVQNARIQAQKPCIFKLARANRSRT